MESLSRLKYAAEQNDVDFSSLTVAIKRWQVTLSQAASGSQDAAGSLKLLHLNAAALKELSLEDQLKKIADQFSRIRDPADQTRVAVELFGRSGEQLVPLLRKGSGAIDELIKKADELGITLDAKTARGADAADKALKRLFATVQAAGARAAGNFALAFLPPEDELDRAIVKLDELKKKRDEFANPGLVLKLTVPESGRNAAVANFNRQIDEQLRAINALQRRAAAGKDSPLAIPDDSKISEVLVTQRKAELIGLAKLLDDFERSTRVSEDKIYQDYKDTVAKIEELSAAHVINETEAAKRIRDARLKYEESVKIDLIDVEAIHNQRVVVTQVLSEQQRAVNKFVDTLSTGLDNLARSGELTGKSILKYLLSAFEAQVLKDAISGLGSYLKKALGGTSGSSSTGSSIGSFINAIFGHAAGGGRGGPRVVGEDGPELDFGGGNIMNRRQLQFAMAGGGSTKVSIGDTNIVVQGNADAQTLAAAQVMIQHSQKKLLEQLNVRLKDSYGRALR